MLCRDATGGSGEKNDAKKLVAIHFQQGDFQIAPQNRFFSDMGSGLGCNCILQALAHRVVSVTLQKKS